MLRPDVEDRLELRKGILDFVTRQESQTDRHAGAIVLQGRSAELRHSREFLGPIGAQPFPVPFPGIEIQGPWRGKLQREAVVGVQLGVLRHARALFRTHDGVSE
jgi:hypothetical protein